tara:strand:- start:459 stop:1718 length:1260 start_codon:yes stop_codon:yes gene_type:complete
MTDEENKESLKFNLETIHVSEIGAESEWEKDGVVTVGAEHIAEMTKGDEKPYFVDFTALYEGLSGNNRHYTKPAVESCVKAMLGVNMYKGHQKPGNESFEYREPVGKVVAARTATIEIDGRRVLAAKGKAYITVADPKLRGDIDRKMAGPLSILGDARSVRELGSQKRTITHIHSPLKSIDFCNPGTNGMALAGVNAVVREMSSSGETEREEPNMSAETKARLSREQLLAEYGPEITSLTGDQVAERIAEMAKGKQELADKEAAFEKEKGELTEKVAEMTTANEKLTKELADSKAETLTANGKLVGAELKVYAATAIQEMKDGEAHDERVVEIAAADLTPELVENDLEKSKAAFNLRLKGAIERTEKIVEMTGGKIQEMAPTTKHTKNTRTKEAPSGKKSDGIQLNDILGSALQPKAKA